MVNVIVWILNGLPDPCVEGFLSSLHLYCEVEKPTVGPRGSQVLGFLWRGVGALGPSCPSLCLLSMVRLEVLSSRSPTVIYCSTTDPNAAELAVIINLTTSGIFSQRGKDA